MRTLLLGRHHWYDVCFLTSTTRVHWQTDKNTNNPAYGIVPVPVVRSSFWLFFLMIELVRSKDLVDNVWRKFTCEWTLASKDLWAACSINHQCYYCFLQSLTSHPQKKQRMLLTSYKNTMQRVTHVMYVNQKEWCYTPRCNCFWLFFLIWKWEWLRMWIIRVLLRVVG